MVVSGREFTFFAALFLTPFSHTCTNLDCLKGRQTYETKTTLSNGYLGSRNDEERSEMRYVMRIAELSESSNL
jgi:trehalose/maltose hydrolase-like predicted phosphorylase